MSGAGKYIPGKFCGYCGRIFYMPYRYGHKLWESRIYCSAICFQRDDTKKGFVTENKKCVVCGDLFYKTIWNKYVWARRDKCSSGCSQINNIIGVKFGKLTVVSLNSKSPVKWNCKCDCGKAVTVSYSHISSGHTKSCGCIRSRPKTHGLAKTPEYRIWNSMGQRCMNKNQISYKHYGGRGISVCERWAIFENFIADMGSRPTSDHQIDRINNDGDYEPANCRWATQIENARNKRTTLWVEKDGKRMTVVEWAEKLNIPAKRIYNRLSSGMSVDRVLSTEIYNNAYKKEIAECCLK